MGVDQIIMGKRIPWTFKRHTKEILKRLYNCSGHGINIVNFDDGSNFSRGTGNSV